MRKYKIFKTCSQENFQNDPERCCGEGGGRGGSCLGMHVRIKDIKILKIF